MKKLFNVLVVLCAVFTMCVFMGCPQPTESGPAAVTEWKSATTTTGGESYYYLTAYDDETWDMSLTATVTDGPSETVDIAKGTYTGDTTIDTSTSNKVEITVTHTWDSTAEEWKPVSGTAKGDATIQGSKLTIPAISGVPSFPEFTKQ